MLIAVLVSIKFWTIDSFTHEYDKEISFQNSHSVNVPHPSVVVCLIIVFASILISMIILLMTLEVELDASFKKAMPILEKKILTLKSRIG